MAYLANIANGAERDFVGLYEEIHAEQSSAALKWYRGMKQAILSLEQSPHRCLATRENDRLRHLVYGHKPHVYRVIYRILEKQKRVDLLYIRHGARRDFTASNLG